MSAQAALKAVSHRDALAKTVRLLTRDGIDVQFRGHQPMVQVKGNKAFRLVLPELNDSASPELLEAIQGFLDHEVGHIFYTPFARATKAGTVDKKAPALINIVEDIRLEKLLPRDLPGTRENLERMYDRFIPMMIHPSTSAMVGTGNPSKAFAGVMVPAMRALSGQKAFQAYMDANGYWPHFMPLLKRMPDLARRLKAMETFDDVVAIVTDVLAAIAPPPEDRTPEPEQQKPQEPQDDDSDDDGADDTDQGGSGSDEPENEPDAGDDDDGPDDADDDSDDGAGTDDEKGEDDSPGDAEEDEGNGDQGDEAADGADVEGGDTPAPEEDGGSDTEEEKNGAGGKRANSLTEALKQLEPTQRKALFMYKNRKQTVAEIASELQSTEDVVLDLLRNARRRLGELMKGKRS